MSTPTSNAARESRLTVGGFTARARPVMALALRKSNATERLAAPAMAGPQARELDEDLDTLHAYLQSREPTARPKSEQRAVLERLWHTAYAQEALALEELAPYRVVLGYRLLREHARLKKLVVDASPLAGGLRCPTAPVTPGDVIDPWSAVHALEAGTSHRPYNEPRSWAALNCMKERPLPLLPPTDPKLTEDYCKLHTYLAISLGIQLDSPGLAQLLDPATVTASWPEPLALISCEELLIARATEVLIQCGQTAAREELASKFSLTPTEAINLVRIAKGNLHEAGKVEIEEERSIMLARLDNFIMRCQETFNQKGELGALIQIGRVLGLTRSDPEDEIGDFVSAMKRITTDDKAAFRSAHPIKTIEARVV